MVGDGERPGAAERVALEVCARTLVTRGELQDLLGRSKSNLTKLVNSLRDAAVIDSEEPKFRRRQHLQVGRNVAVLGGVDFEETGARVMLTDARYNPLIPEPIQVRNISIDHGPHGALAAVTDTLQGSLEEIDPAEHTPLALGLSVPGPVDRYRETAASTQILGNLSKLDPRTFIQKRLGRAPAEQLENPHAHPGTAEELDGREVWVAIHNDASLGALGLRLMEVLDGAVPPPRALLYLRVSGAGIGCGITVNGELFDGETGLAGEFGHIKVNETGQLCPNCGGVGCIETIASDRAILEKVRGSGAVPDATSINAVIDSSHRACARALRDAGWQVGIALSHAYNLLNPSRVVIGGSASQSTNFMRYVDHALLRDALDETLVRRVGDRTVRVKPEPVDPDAWLPPELAGALALAGRTLLPSLVRRLVRTELGTQEDLDRE